MTTALRKDVEKVVTVTVVIVIPEIVTGTTDTENLQENRVKTQNKWIKRFNRIFVCPFCVYRCKGEPNLALRYRATRKKHSNRLVCGSFIISM